jgi:hemolysin activation/secretion protein
MLHNPQTAFLGLVFSMVLFILSNSVIANENPVDTLPQPVMPEVTPQPEIRIEEGEALKSEELRKRLEKQITPRRFAIRGVKTIDFSEVRDIFIPYANKAITVGKLVELSKSVTRLYQQRGYPLSFCYIPAQSFDKDIIQVVVVEGYVKDITISGNPGNTEAKIREIAGHMLQERPLTKATMERYSTTLSTLPGIKVRASLPLPKNPDGATNLVLDIKRKPIDLIGRVELIDPFTRGIVTLKSSGQTSLAEEVTFSTLVSKDDEEYYALTYAQPIGSEGMIMRLDGSTYDGTPTTNLGSDIKRQVSSDRAGIAFTYPFLLEKNRRFTGNVGFTATSFEDEIRNRLNGRMVTTSFDVRTFSMGGTYFAQSSTQSNVVRLNLSKGADALGAQISIKANFPTVLQNNPAKLDFSKALFNFEQKNSLKQGWGTAVSMTAQYSPDDLPLTEHVLFGGFQYGRAFSPGTLSGDKGWGVGLELNRTVPSSLKMLTYQLSRIQPYFLAEYARAYNKDNIEPLRTRIGSATLGLRLISNDPERARIDLSLSKAVEGGDGRNFFKNLGFGINFGIPFN